MKRYESLVSDKKKLVRKVEAIMETRAAYTYVPRCAYQVGCIFIEKDGNLTTENETATEEVIAKLQAEGVLGGELPESTTPSRVRVIRAAQPDPEPIQQSNTNYFEPIMETWQPETTGEETQADITSRAWEFPSFSIPVRRTSKVTMQEENAEEQLEETAEEENVQEEIATGEAEPAEEPQSEDLVEQVQQEEVTETTSDETDPLDVSISFPIAGHTGMSLINLINTIYSRGSLLTKATQGEFSCDASFVKELGLEEGLYQTGQVIAFIKDYEPLLNIRISTVM